MDASLWFFDKKTELCGHFPAAMISSRASTIS